MIILERLYSDNGNHRLHLAPLFGIGLIGRAIAAYAMRTLGFTAREFAFDWSNTSQRARDADAIKAYILERRSTELPAKLGRLDILWAAGKAGFGSSTAEIELELAAFDDVLALGRRLFEGVPSKQRNFHLLSSAGGLFEGQRQVSGASTPAPLRPYGCLKLEQEQRLADLAETKAFIYRPSSVYGFSGSGVRLGLMNALIQNAVRHRVSTIYGEPHSVRDYILASDVGHFISRQLVSESASNTFLLASAKPSSIFELLRKIELIVGRKIFIHFDTRPSNSSNMSFCQSSLPPDWRPTDLDSGIRMTARQLMNSLARAN
ncbi:NAD-dependent epimerase/dehydratase family protein [Microvirga zambiensis]|uniref:NAD-dependent epimerase/dehydratase family protein n=1 Tax=Microvirga zambiensis TaxID=1402137 RepID=UPI00191D38DA|nr:NAD-dependent epimerase/dehydratase family protein [Microvirga zambiensis]